LRRRPRPKLGCGAKELKKDLIVGTCNMNEETRSACKVLVGNTQGRRPFGRTDDGKFIRFEIHLTELRFRHVTETAQDAVQRRTCVNNVNTFCSIE
jgi:hypothetical protein